MLDGSAAGKNCGFQALTNKRGAILDGAWLLAILSLLLWSLPALAIDSDDYLREAKTYLESGKTKHAVIQLKNALLVDHDNNEARLLLGKTYLEMKNGLSAEKELRRAWENGVSREAVTEPLGRALLMTGQNEKLLQTINDEAADSATLKLDILILHGQAYLADQKNAMAKEKFTRALELQPATAEAMIGNAVVAYEERDVKTAGVLVDKALSVAPNNQRAWILKGRLLSDADKPQEAILAFQKALEIEPDNIPAHLEKARVLIVMGENDAALKEVEQVQNMYPGLSQAIYVMALAQYQQADLEQAQKSIQRVLNQEPSHLPSILLAGAIAYHLGQFNQAENYLRSYWNRNPDNNRAGMLFAVVLLKLDQPGKAVEVLEQGLHSADEDAQYISILGSAYLADGQTEQGIKYLKKAIKLSPGVATYHARLAIGQMAAGNVDLAVNELKTSIDLGQDLVQTDFLLIMAYLYSEQFDNALAAANVLMEKTPDSPVPHNLAGTALYGKGDREGASAAYQQALQIQEDFLPASFNLAQLDLIEGDSAAAKKRYEEILSYDENNLKALLALAELAKQEKEDAGVERWLEQAYTHHPDDIEPALLLAEYYQRKGDYTSALLIARKISIAQPRNPAVLLALGYIQLEADELKDARNTLRTLVEVSPDSSEANYLSGVLELKLNEISSARSYLQKAIEIKADFPAAQLLLGRLYIGEKEYDAASAVADDMAKAHPEAAYVNELRGDVHTAKKEYSQAVDAYTHAYDLESSAQLAYKIFQSSLQIGETESAYKALVRWLEENPGDIRIRTTLASILQQQGHNQRAKEQYLLVLEYDADNGLVLNNLAWLYHEEGSNKGIPYAEHAHELAPDQAEVTDTLGWLLVQNGDINRGLVLLQEAAVKAPHIPEIRYHMAVALTKAGRRDEARKVLDRLLKSGKGFQGIEDARKLRNQLG
jgi:putative PEP-CTERM system TPR-repeat lipoprotein